MAGNFLFKAALNLKFFEQEEFESLKGCPEEQHPSITARNALRLLMMGWPKSWTELISWPLIKAMFIRRDSLLLKEFRLSFQHGFYYLLTQLQGEKLDEHGHEQVQLYLSNCLCLLPLADLTPYESISIPQYINGQWILVDYHVHPIELTPTKGVERFFIKDHDRVFAYGLEPINQKEAQSHLIFMGTTYPAGQGFIPQVANDLKGFDSVGGPLYEQGRELVAAWLLRQINPVHVCGISLGGSLALLMAIDLGKNIARVDALNPPGLHELWYKNKYDRWDDILLKPKVVIQLQGNDPVSLFGIWKKEWILVRVIPPRLKQGPNAFCDHFMNYAGLGGTEFSQISVEEENQNRTSRNFWIFSLMRGIVYYTAVVPIRYMLLPCLYFIYENRKNLLKGILVNAGYFFRLLMNEEENRQHAKLHDPELIRNPSLDLYNPAHLIQIDLTHQELNTYYQVTRCLLKGKGFFPTHNQPVKHNKDGLSKKELLQVSQDPQKQQALVTYKVTKAKAVHISRTLWLVRDIGMEQPERLKSALEENYTRYTSGFKVN